MTRLSVDDINFENKRALVRVDFNVRLDEHKNITNDFRIVSSLPTLKKILEDGGSVICMSHLGRPKGKINPDFSLKPVQKRLSELLGIPVQFAVDCIGESARDLAQYLEPGEVLLLENLRFHSGETDNDPGFSRRLAKLADVYVNDAFGTSHRAHASTTGVPEHFNKSVNGRFLY